MSKNNKTNPENSTPLTLTVTLRDLIESQESLKEISASKVSAKLSFTIGVVLRAVQPFLAEFYKQRDNLLNEHYQKEENGQRKPKSQEGRVKFEDELNLLQDTDVTLNGIGRIRVSTLESEGIKLDGADVAGLYWLLKNDLELAFETE